MYRLANGTSPKPPIRRGKILTTRDRHGTKPGFVRIVTVVTVSSQRILGGSSSIAGYLLKSKMKVSVEFAGIIIVQSAEAGQIGKLWLCRVVGNGVGDVGAEGKIVDYGTILI